MKKHFVGLTTVCLALMMGVTSVSAFTPPGLAKKDGLPPGIQKNFIIETEDMKYITEILEILKKKGINDLNDLIDMIEKVDTIDNKEYKTTIKDINVKERRVFIEDGTAVLSLFVSKEAKIYLNEKTAKLEDLRKSDKISMKLDKNKTVIEIKATREKEVKYTIEGEFVLISEDNEKIYIYEDKKLANYKLDPSVVVRINGEKTRLSKLTRDMEIKLTIENEKVILIEAVKEEEPERLEGRILAKYDGKEPLIIVEIDNDIKVFNVDKDVDISQVKVDKEAVIYVKDNEIISIRTR